MFEALLLGIVEGLTEFLPISSTGHLIVLSQWLNTQQTDSHIAFEVIIQLAAILAVLGQYGSKLTPGHLPLAGKLFVAFLPIAVIGLVFKDPLEALFLNAYIVPIMFIAGGLVFLVVEYFYTDQDQPTRQVENISWTQAAVIGAFQVFALIPGTSRAGSTIIGAMLCGLDRRASAEFSFLLALPVMIAASGYKLVENYNHFSIDQIEELGVGFAAAFISASITMRLLLRFLQNHTFVGFAIYRILFGVLLLSTFG